MAFCRWILKAISVPKSSAAAGSARIWLNRRHSQNAGGEITESEPSPAYAGLVHCTETCQPESAGTCPGFGFWSVHILGLAHHHPPLYSGGARGGPSLRIKSNSPTFAAPPSSSGILKISALRILAIMIRYDSAYV